MKISATFLLLLYVTRKETLLFVMFSIEVDTSNFIRKYVKIRIKVCLNNGKYVSRCV